MAENIIRDSVHDVIAFQMDRPTDALLFRLLAAPELQRLRRIRQLGLASLAYPGADHSRGIRREDPLFVSGRRMKSASSSWKWCVPTSRRSE